MKRGGVQEKGGQNPLTRLCHQNILNGILISAVTSVEVIIKFKLNK